MNKYMNSYSEYHGDRSSPPEEGLSGRDKNMTKPPKVPAYHDDRLPSGDERLEVRRDLLSEKVGGLTTQLVELSPDDPKRIPIMDKIYKLVDILRRLFGQD